MRGYWKSKQGIWKFQHHYQATKTEQKISKVYYGDFYSEHLNKVYYGDFYSEHLNKVYYGDFYSEHLNKVYYGDDFMKLEEFDALFIDGSISTENLLKLRDSIAETETAMDELKNQVQESNKRISELQETNGKLYLRVTTGSETVLSKDEITVDDIIKDWGKI